jgi:alanine-synthesizing transaminase
MSDLDRAVRHSVPPPTALVLNFPSNPTAMVVAPDFYREVVEYCRAPGIYVLSDLAYIAVEFTSMSKTYSMPGWRIGFAAGNAKLIGALARIKSYLDYGAFTPIQVAAAVALNGPQDCVAEMRETYRRRRDVLVESFAAAGWDIPPPPATMFAWAPIPPQFAHLGSLEFSKVLLQEAHVAVSPGLGFGEYGDGHVRIALVENRQRIRQAARNVKSFFAAADRALGESERRRALAS